MSDTTNIVSMIVLSALLAFPAFANNDMQGQQQQAGASVDNAGDTTKSAQESSAVYEDPTGVQAFFYEDGRLQKILAVGEAELEFGDRKDERQALQIATMRAKASIAKFMNESIKSKEIREEIQKTVSNATADGNKTATRDTVTTQIETLEDNAESILQGVVTLQQDIDRDKKLATVTVGMKEQTIQAAKNLQGQIAASEMAQSQLTSSKSDTQSSGGGKEIRRSKAMENF